MTLLHARLVGADVETGLHRPAPSPAPICRSALAKALLIGHHARTLRPVASAQTVTAQTDGSEKRVRKVRVCDPR